MIIFDLDGTLADCEHRRHFVDPKKDPTVIDRLPLKPDWKSFYEACGEDTPIECVVGIWNDQISLGAMGVHEIWSGRCESVRKKTEEWLDKYLLCFQSHQLKMRPIGDYTPDDQLKERWLDEHIAIGGKPIDFVFDDRPKVVKMWRKRGIFVFDCNQTGKEF